MSSTPVGRDELGEIFRTFESAPHHFRIGAEHEKFAVDATTGRPLGYGGELSVCRVFSFLEREHGWSPIREVAGGPVLGLERDGASITLEPGAQVELSGKPLRSLHEVAREEHQHLEELVPISQEMNLAWLAVGFHPTASLEELSWVPKQRYPIMRSYLPQKGAGALDMMQRTATVQGNFDWSSEEDGMRKLLVSLKLSPLMHAWFVNAPFVEGKVGSGLSARGRVWTRMDPSRSGLIPALWGKKRLRYDDYVEWSLDAGMFLFWRDGKIIQNTGQTFRSFLNDGFEGHRATLADYKLHLTTLFPEVRLKNTLEVRSMDNLSPDVALSALAVWTGLLYDETALSQVEELVEPLTHSGVEGARPELIDRGLHGSLGSRTGFSWAERLLEIAQGGLARRALRDSEGRTEEAYLGPAAEIVESRILPAERVLARFEATGSIIEASRLPLPG